MLGIKKGLLNRPSIRYGIAIGGVAVAFLLRLVLTRYVGPGLPTYITFYPAVMFAAILGGFWAGLLATVMAALLTAYWFLPPTESFRIESTTDVVGLVLFCGMAVFMSVVAELYRHSRQKVAGYEKELALRESKEALRKSEERYRTLFEESRDAIYTTSREGEIVDANRSMFNLFGYSREEMIGLKARETYVLSEDRLKFQQKIEREGFVRDYEIKLRKKGGTEMDCLLTATVRGTADGNILGYQGIIRDITEPKKMEEALRKSEEKYRTILKNIEEGYYEVDLAGNFTFLNDSMCRIFGYPKEELMGMNDRQYTDKENARRLFQAFNATYRTGEPHIGYGYEIIRKDGTKRYIEASILLQKDSSDKPIGFRGIIRDVTERKRMEEEREKLIHELQDALANIRTLRGLLPICSYCKKIRDDKGYWNQIESYIQDHSGAEFTHGMCPECLKKLYPDLVD